MNAADETLALPKRMQSTGEELANSLAATRGVLVEPDDHLDWTLPNVVWKREARCVVLLDEGQESNLSHGHDPLRTPGWQW